MLGGGAPASQSTFFLILDQMVAFDLRLALVDATRRSVSISKPSAAQGGLVLTGREEHLTRCGQRAEGGRRISYDAADNISATKRPTQQMFSKDPTRSRASLLQQRDGHEAASSFHRDRVERAAEQFRASRTNSPQPAIAPASGLVPLVHVPHVPQKTRRLDEAPDRGPIRSSKSLQRTSDPVEIPPGASPVLTRPPVLFPWRLDAETPVDAAESFAQRLIIKLYH